MNYRYEYQYRNRRARNFELFEDFLEAIRAATSNDHNKINRQVYETGTNRIVCSMNQMDNHED
jgi:hypothetical protein